MKLQAAVDGVVYADYYVPEKALDHARLALEDDRFAAISLTKLNDDGTAFVAASESPAVPSPAVQDL
jgi:hypothetical protein